MLRSSATRNSALKSSREFELPGCFTFWDMDDTCVNTRDNSIKNPHLLLPIMLYQSVSRNQNFGICTNRGPEDAEGCYPVASFIKELATFGIDLPKRHVIYGGGVNNAKFAESYQDLQRTLEGLTLQLQAIELTETAQHIQSGLDHIKNLVLKDKTSPSQADANKNGVAFLGAQIERAGYLGKNFHINNFLKEHYDSHSKGFRFGGYFVSEDELVCGIVDDRAEIASPEIVASLGENYFGIKASDGGNPPKTIDLKGDYYQDQYLFAVAEKIGLDELSRDILSNSAIQCDPRLHMAGLLYAWQKKPELCTLDMVVKALYRLNLKQCDQTVAMLVAIDKQANRHSDAHYHDIEKLLVVAHSIATEKFLECAHEKIVKVRTLIADEKKRTQENSILATKSDSDLMHLESKAVEQKKSKFSFSFRKSSASSKSTRSSATLAEQPKVEELQSSTLMKLLNKEKVLTQRLEELKSSPRNAFSKLAQEVEDRLSEKCEQSTSASSQTYLPSRSNTRTIRRAEARQLKVLLPSEDDSVQKSGEESPSLKSKTNSSNGF